jgi:beta-carotene 15,15'-dioxygenase
VVDAARRWGTLAAAGVVAVLGSGGAGWQAALALALFVTLGLPHGALDHRVGSQELGWSWWFFHGAYVATGLLVAVAWFLWPPLAAVAFLGLSAWHFGEADVRALDVRRGWRPPLILARGALVVGLLASAWPSEVAALLGPWALLPAQTPRTLAAPISLWALNASLLVVAHRGSPARLAQAFLDAAAVAAWLWAAEPLLAFAGYFTVWHSFDHLRLLGERLRLRPSALAAAVIPYTVLAAAGGAAIAAIGLGVGAATSAAAALGAIAAVATPHLVLVELWRAGPPAAAPRATLAEAHPVNRGSGRRTPGSRSAAPRARTGA